MGKGEFFNQTTSGEYLCAPISSRKLHADNTTTFLRVKWVQPVESMWHSEKGSFSSFLIDNMLHICFYLFFCYPSVCVSLSRNLKDRKLSISFSSLPSSFLLCIILPLEHTTIDKTTKSRVHNMVLFSFDRHFLFPSKNVTYPMLQ
jgi:hypothetical protein